MEFRCLVCCFNFLMLTLFLSILKKVSKITYLGGSKRQRPSLVCHFLTSFFQSLAPVLSFPSYSKWSHRLELLRGSQSTQDDLWTKRSFHSALVLLQGLRLLKVSMLCPWLSHRPYFLVGILYASRGRAMEISTRGSRALWEQVIGFRPHWAAAGAGAEPFQVLVPWDVLN